MTYVKTQLPTLKTHVVNLKRDAKDLSRDLQRLEVRGKLGSKTLYCRRGASCNGSDSENCFSVNSFAENSYSSRRIRPLVLINIIRFHKKVFVLKNFLESDSFTNHEMAY